MRIRPRSVITGGLGASLTMAGLFAGALPARAAGAVFDRSGAVQVVGSTVVVSTGAVDQLDLRWKLSRPTPAVAVVVPVPTAAAVQGAESGIARDAADTTAPQRTSFLLRPWILAGEGGGDARAARDALQAPTQQVRVSAASLVQAADLPATLGRVVPGMSSAAAREAAAAVVHHALPGSRYAVALLEPQSGSQLRAGWVGTLRLAIRGGVQTSSTLPLPGDPPSQVSVPLPGGVLGARGPQVLAVTADTTMRAADPDNVAPVVSGIDRAAGGRWQTVLYGQGGGQAAAADVVEATDSPAPFHAVEPVLLPDLHAWPWVLAGAVLVVLAVVVLARGRWPRRPSA